MEYKTICNETIKRNNNFINGVGKKYKFTPEKTNNNTKICNNKNEYNNNDSNINNSPFTELQRHWEDEDYAEWSKFLNKELI